MLADRLTKAWAARHPSMSIEMMIRLTDDGLVLGAGTLLARLHGAGRDVSIDPFDPRLLALLTPAHLRRPTDGALVHLRKAVERWREGEDSLAAMHLVLSGLDRLRQPEADAHRLFLADGLLAAGIDADVIVRAIESGAVALESLHRYDADQPRVPPGSGRTSGQWTADGGGAASGSTPSGRLAPRSRSGRRSPAAMQRPTSLVPQSDVNPGTIMPAAGRGALAIDETCQRAASDCFKNLLGESYRGHPNDNFRLNLVLQCQKIGYTCDYLVWVLRESGRKGHVTALYPDGGFVIISTQAPPIYIKSRRFARLSRSALAR